MIILKVTKNHDFTLSLENTFFEEPQGRGGGGVKLTPAAVLGLIQKIIKQATAEETRTICKRIENFWVLKLKTSHPDGLRQELNNFD